MTNIVPIEVRLLTDEEIDAAEKAEKKKSLLESLKSASTPTGFSTKRIKEKVSSKQKTEETDRPTLSSISMDDPIESSVLLPERPKLKPIDDDRWSEMVEDFRALNPIDEITTEERNLYRRKSDGDQFDDLFIKERSMLSEILTDIQSRSKAINGKLKSLTGKGTYGISKNMVDLAAVANSMDSNKLQVIKTMADLKKTSADLRMKAQKAAPDESARSVDSVADDFYKSIIGGGTQKFIQSSMRDFHNTDEYTPSDGKFNITQPFTPSDHYQPDEPVYDDDSDPYGYIKNEARNVEVVLYRYDNGEIEFVAVDEDGNKVYDYELPASDILDSIDIKPMSNYGYDRYQRKYRIVDISSTVDISDLDDYDDRSYDPDDKYSY